MPVSEATTEAALRECLPILRELRGHLSESELLTRVLRLRPLGYRLACLRRDGIIVAVAGFRVSECLAWGRFLYLDDLVTTETERSRGAGAELLRWLEALARIEGCAEIHLDSRSDRKGAHRFYGREGYATFGLHFVKALGGDLA